MSLIRDARFVQRQPSNRYRLAAAFGVIADLDRHSAFTRLSAFAYELCAIASLIERIHIPSLAAYVPCFPFNFGMKSAPAWWRPITSQSAENTGLPELPGSVGAR